MKNLDFIIESIIKELELKQMNDKYYKSLPDDKKYAYYKPGKNVKYWKLYSSNKTVGYAGIIFEENKYFAIVYIEEKYRNKNLLKLIYKELIKKCGENKLYAKVEKDNAQAMKAHKKLFKNFKNYDNDHVVFEVKL
ncbi:MAG: GNAT family N-acetyltransferase [Candidatus Izimaplasma sp.]|nr:GNAT family N-acetyltransferase [Candidatus Izimaplasma bacterium]